MHAGSRPHYNLTFGILTLGALAYSLLQSLVVPAIHQLQIDLGASTTGATWVLTSFLLSASVAIPILGRLGDMYGRVRIYNLGFVVFTVAAIALSFDPFQLGGGAVWLIGWRVIQGVGGAMLMASSSAILTDAFPANQRGMALGTNMVAAVAGFAELLRGGRYNGALTYDDVVRIANAARGPDEYGYRSEFVQLVRAAKGAKSLATLER